MLAQTPESEPLDQVREHLAAAESALTFISQSSDWVTPEVFEQVEAKGIFDKTQVILGFGLPS